LLRGLALLLAVSALAERAHSAPLASEASNALHRAIQFFRTEVAVQGTYVWEYSEDLTLREGEGVVTATQGWVQPPGTPAVGMAFLQAYEATAHPEFLAAARESAAGLRLGQLMSGGWYASIDFAPQQRGQMAYRLGGNPRKRNTSTLDDDITPSALRFLMRLDRVLGFKESSVHDVVVMGLKGMVGAQYPNGAWPQVFQGPPDASKHPVRPAAFPESWPRTYPGHQNYWYFYTLNDNVLANVIETLFEAETTYTASPDPEDQALARACRTAAERGGEFILRAQLPEPQPAWAQQYNFDMHPSWARKFEPPAVTGGESQQIMRTLMDLYRRTGDAKYLEPIPRSLAYLKRSRLPNGRLARFYELKTNRPLYFTTDYELTYDDGDMPTHYSFKVGDGTAAIEREFQHVQATPWPQLKAEMTRKTARPDPAAVRRVFEAQDVRGRWVEPGPLRFHRPKDPGINVIRCSTFVKNVELLSRFLEGEKEGSSTDQ